VGSRWAAFAVTFCGCGRDYLAVPLDHRCEHPRLDPTSPPPQPRRGSDLEAIAQVVGKAYDLSVAEIVQPAPPHRTTGTARRCAEARGVVVVLARELTELSFPDIGRQLGGRDHTTVLAARRRVLKDRTAAARADTLLRLLRIVPPKAALTR
jgi:hypothetical protein